MSLIIIPKRYVEFVIFFVLGSLTIYSAWRLSNGFHQTVYFSLIARIPEFLIGGFFAAGNIGERWRSSTSNFFAITGFVLVCFSFWFVTEESEFPGLLSIPPCMGIALVIAAKDSVMNQLLSNRFLVWIGALSYSLYLWHWPVLAVICYYDGEYTFTPFMLVVFSIVTVFCAVVSYYFIEMSLKNNKALGLTLPILFAATLIVTVFVSVILNPKLVSPLNVELTRYAPANKICHGLIVGDCIRGDQSANNTILLLGDSHAAQLNLFADELGQRSHSKVKVITASSCVTIDGFDVERLPQWARSPYRKQIQLAKSNIESANSIIVAGMWQYQSASPAFLRALDLFISNAASRGKPVIVLAQVPMLQVDVQRAYRFKELGFVTLAKMDKD